MTIELVPVERLRHIEGFSRKRVDWLADKIMTEGVWRRPVVLDSEHFLVMDGQHRMEVAKLFELDVIPAVLLRYSDVEVWTLRPKYQFTWEDVVARALASDPYPYKTVKHGFPDPIPSCQYQLASLRSNRSGS